MSPTGLSRELFGRSNKVSRMESLEESVNVHILEKASQYLSDNWPEDLEWPEDIERPPAKELAE